MSAESFAGAVLEELWLGGRLAERRLTCGEAIERDGTIHARDTREASLIAACEAAVEAMRALVVPQYRIRLLAEATAAGTPSAITVSSSGCSIVTTPDHVQSDLALLRGAEDLAPTMAMDGCRDPLLWLHGSAAVLLHEAIGHPLELGLAPPVVPEWLHYDIPLVMRRASFREVPLLRMEGVTITTSQAPFVLPARRVEVQLVDGGGYDPLTDIVTVRVAHATLVDGQHARPCAPFTLAARRAAVLRSLRGAQGEPQRYPGVVCSREGQALVVQASAPLVLTELT